MVEVENGFGITIPACFSDGVNEVKEPSIGSYLDGGSAFGALEGVG